MNAFTSFSLLCALLLGADSAFAQSSLSSSGGGSVGLTLIGLALFAWAIRYLTAEPKRGDRPVVMLYKKGSE